MEFYDSHADRRDRFEILAFHDPSAKSIKEIDKKLTESKIIADAWHGRNLPFPVLLDADKTTMQAWGIDSFPTVVLIDPQGNLVRGDEQTLGMELSREAAARDGGHGAASGADDPG